MVYNEKCMVLANEKIAENIYKMKVQIKEKPKGRLGGKFINVKIPSSDMLLKRPFGIADYDDNSITFCYQLAGEGTRILKDAKIDTELEATYPLGNGFLLPNECNRIAIIGGGVGVFPLACVLKEQAYNNKEVYSFIGYRNKNAICFYEEFEFLSDAVFACTDDGSSFTKNNSVNLFLENYESVYPDIILACGPPPMLRALKNSLKKENITIKTMVSLEERMGCGIGACLVCVCKRSDVEENYRICKDGPVFDIWEVEI